jgi:hypothetical protein
MDRAMALASDVAVHNGSWSIFRDTGRLTPRWR